MEEAGTLSSSGSDDPWNGGASGFGTVASGTFGVAGTIPNDAYLISQKVNAVRLPLNEQAWLDYSGGNNPDLQGNYKQTVEKAVAQYTGDGLYVILDLHWNGTGPNSPATSQQEMADTTYSASFWTSIAGAFKGNPAVIFELYNEPHNCCTNAQLNTGTGGWEGYQPMLNAVRATGATNVVLMGGLVYSNDETWWTSNAPTDSIHQIALAHHDYNQGLTYELGLTGTQAAAISMLNAAGVPVVIDETSCDSNGVTSYLAPSSEGAGILPLADTNHYSVIAWAANPAAGYGAPNLTQTWNNSAGTATTTTCGAYFFNWTATHL
jgi:aryl-phospho-beta-D-glucosidase BglC (GH1 family)